MKNKLFLSIYLGFSVFYLLITVFNQEEIAQDLKPFLLPILLVAVYFSERLSVMAATGSFLLF